eukprot:TRINITY_DN4883_c1_g1_i1.p2 TRINITY_DN4883_c1_g1~~TRINITY_DN4883_c1_g1_i1.p2  ORF type:complete len:449 (+),score=161.91 TRINITY_DN4883_c1_g1_i1:74-1420(+)
MDCAAALECLRRLLSAPHVAAVLGAADKEAAAAALAALGKDGAGAPEPEASPAPKRQKTAAAAPASASDAAAAAAGVKASGTFFSFARKGDATADIAEPAAAALSAPPEGFGTPLGTEYAHAVGDLVWVKLVGFPAWPGELLAKDVATTAVKSKKYTLPVRLFHAPGKYADHGGVVYTNNKNITYYDRLKTEGELARCLKYRLMSDRYDTKAYEAQYATAVRAANAHSRGVMTPEALVSYPVTPVGIAYTNFRAHYQAPRQPHANEAVKKETGVIVLRDGLENLLRDLGKFERIWVVFQFSYSGTTNRAKKQASSATVGDAPTAVSEEQLEFFNGWKAMIVPPRDTKAHGLYATRSPHRPNAIGLSCCRVLNVSGRVLTIRDHDLLHGTPILDVKPYLPYCDAHPAAKAGWVDDLGDRAGPDHRWNDREYTVHRHVQPADADKLTSHS